MNKKLLKILSDKCKDMGLTEKAIQDLAEQGSEGLTDESSDEDIEKSANSLVPIAKIMQGEITRKAQNKKQTETEAGSGAGGGLKGNDGMPDWFKAYKEENDQKVSALLAENEKFKAEQAKNQRTSAINTKAKELGIPESLMKRFHMNDDEDIEEVLTAYKQDLVTNKLMPEDAGGGTKVPDESATKSEGQRLLGQYAVSE